MADKRVLVVEDEDAIRVLLLTILQRRGFRVDSARNGVEALERCSRCHYAVVLLDIMMPLMDGYAFLTEMSRRPAAERPVIIAMTAGTPPRNVDPEIVAGTMRKPFNVALLVDTIDACVAACERDDQPDGCPPADSDAGSTHIPRGNPN